MTRSNLAVWGDPIAHSRSPQLHSAAYRALGLDWEYTRRRVDEVAFGDALASLDDSWRGLSLTMPLKEQAHRAAVIRDRHADLTGAVNTLLLADGPQGFNTDVGGIIDALGEDGVADVDSVRILGAGATAASALVAVAEMGARRVDVRARRPRRAEGLLALAVRLGLTGSVQTFDVPAEPVSVTIATLPSGTSLDERVVARLGENGGVLFDVAYAPWPSTLAARWPGRSISGLGMLLHQAVRQIRIFHHGDQYRALPDEESMVEAMRGVLRS